MNISRRSYTIRQESFKTHRPFVIARGQKTTADQLTVTIAQGPHHGIGTCVPYERYGETMESVSKQIKSVENQIQSNTSLEKLQIHIQKQLPSGAARNAVDCALWDLRAQISRKPVWELCNLSAPKKRVTAVTLSINSPEEMATLAKESNAPLLKIKCAGDGHDILRLTAIIKAVPNTKLIIDANEAFTRQELDKLVQYIATKHIALIEQPVKAGEDHALKGFTHRDLLCADESFHKSDDMKNIAAYYGAINIKLDKAGGFTEAKNTVLKAREEGLTIMLGCMLGSSRAMAPAFMLNDYADFIDLDGPILLAEDDPDGFCFEGHTMMPSSLWGVPRLKNSKNITQ